jgi:hypothetical protein
MDNAISIVEAGETLAMPRMHGDAVCSDGYSVKRACSALQVTASILNAVITHPGVECDDHDFAETTRALMRQASRLADAAIVLLDIKPEEGAYGDVRAALRQRAAEFVSTQHRIAHTAGAAALPLDRFEDIYRSVLDDSVPADAQSTDLVMAKRVALFSVAAEVQSAVVLFDYFSPDPTAVVEKGALHVLHQVDHALDRFMPVGSDESAKVLATQVLLERGGELYASIWRALSRKDVQALMQMNPLERMRHLHIHRDQGLPTQHIDAGFDRVMLRMMDMVCKAVPDIYPSAQPRAEEAPECHP